MSESLGDVYVDYGPLILGGLIAFALSGCVSMQFIMYWRVYPDERWPTRSLVILTWLLDLCHSAFIGVAIWDSVIADYGNLQKLDFIPWSVGPAVESTATMTFLVQSFFAYRIYRLQSALRVMQNYKLIVAGPVFILAFIRLIAATVSMAEMLTLQSYAAFTQPFPSWVFTLGLVLSAFVDVVITTFLCHLFRSNRSRVLSTNRIMDILTFWTVQNGSMTCLGTIASLICWLAMPQNRIFLGLHFVMGKLYANSLLATLNARNTIRNSGSRMSSSSRTPRLPPATLFSRVAVRDGDKRDDPGSPRRNPPQMRLDRHRLEPLDLGSRSIEVNVHRTVESRFDHKLDADELDVTSESAHQEQGSRTP
ncbi:hypothetical protein JVU11DRAFT_11248 [Chiua virens]|nr:hypothetical protein JVU11DRAFT_11248 [Chiua virens]